MAAGRARGGVAPGPSTPSAGADATAGMSGSGGCAGVAPPGVAGTGRRRGEACRRVPVARRSGSGLRQHRRRRLGCDPGRDRQGRVCHGPRDRQARPGGADGDLQVRRRRGRDPGRRHAGREHGPALRSAAAQLHPSSPPAPASARREMPGRKMAGPDRPVRNGRRRRRGRDRRRRGRDDVCPGRRSGLGDRDRIGPVRNGRRRRRGRDRRRRDRDDVCPGRRSGLGDRDRSGPVRNGRRRRRGRDRCRRDRDDVCPGRRSGLGDRDRSGPVRNGRRRRRDRDDVCPGWRSGLGDRLEQEEAERGAAGGDKRDEPREGRPRQRGSRRRSGCDGGRGTRLRRRRPATHRRRRQVVFGRSGNLAPAKAAPDRGQVEMLVEHRHRDVALIRRRRSAAIGDGTGSLGFGHGQTSRIDRATASRIGARM